MTTNETSFDLLRLIISEDEEAYAYLNQYTKNCGKLLIKTVDLSFFAAVMEVTVNELSIEFGVVIRVGTGNWQGILVEHQQ